MKSRIFLTLLLLISFSFLMSDMNFGIGIDSFGDYQEKDESYDDAWATNIGIEVFAEYLRPLQKAENSNLSYGVGAGYLFPREFTPLFFINFNNGFGFIPIYLIGQYNIEWKKIVSFMGN